MLNINPDWKTPLAKAGPGGRGRRARPRATEKSSHGVQTMKALVKTLKARLVALRDDEEGAAMIEYSVLIGLITALVIALVVTVGQWVENAWNDLNAALT